MSLRFEEDGMPRCPKCGGSESRPIAAGYAECTTVVPVVSTQMIHDPIRGGPRPVESQQFTPCGNRYHDGSAESIAGAQCDCGTFAIGLCSSCNRPICGDHSISGD